MQSRQLGPVEVRFSRGARSRKKDEGHEGVLKSVMPPGMQWEGDRAFDVMAGSANGL